MDYHRYYRFREKKKQKNRFTYSTVKYLNLNMKLLSDLLEQFPHNGVPMQDILMVLYSTVPPVFMLFCMTNSPVYSGGKKQEAVACLPASKEEKKENNSYDIWFTCVLREGTMRSVLFDIFQAHMTVTHNFLSTRKRIVFKLRIRTTYSCSSVFTSTAYLFSLTHPSHILQSSGNAI